MGSCLAVSMVVIVGMGPATPTRGAVPLDLHLGLGVANDPLAVLLGEGVDDGAPVGDLADGAGDEHLLLGYAHAAKLNGEALEVLGPTGGLGLGAGDLSHAPETVQDTPWQPDGTREILVDVDWVEVP